ncbi:MAG: IPT/TIG domain-containing protein [Gemmatimonadaceae bacterium]
MSAGNRGAAAPFRLRWRAAFLAGSVALACAVAQGQASPCRAHKASATRSRVSLEAPPVRRGDTLHTVHVCLHPARSVSIGSFHVVLEYDSTRLHAVRFVQAASGTMVANLAPPGRTDVAGASPSGFEPGELLTVVFADARRAKRAPIAVVLRLLELNATQGQSLLARADAAGIGVLRPPPAPPPEPLRPKSAETPHIDSLIPAGARTAGPGGLVTVTIHGSGFHPDGNVVLFAGAEIAELESVDGTSLHLVLPSSLPATGEVPPRIITAGRYEIRVRTSTGTSNPMEFTLETRP